MRLHFIAINGWLGWFVALALRSSPPCRRYDCHPPVPNSNFGNKPSIQHEIKFPFEQSTIGNVYCSIKWRRRCFTARSHAVVFIVCVYWHSLANICTRHWLHRNGSTHYYFLQQIACVSSSFFIVALWGYEPDIYFFFPSATPSSLSSLYPLQNFFYYIDNGRDIKNTSISRLAY